MPLFPCNGGFDGSIAAADPRFPKHRSPDMLNVLVRDGVSVKWPGHLPYMDVAIPGTDPRTDIHLRFVADFPLSTGSRFLVVSDGYRLFKQNAGKTGWDEITPRYDTGTVGVPVGSPTTVHGTGTTWVTDRIKIGHRITFDGYGGSWGISAVTDETTLELEQTPGVIPAGTSYHIDMTLEATGKEWIRGVIGTDQLIIANGCDPPLMWDGMATRAVLLPKTAGATNYPPTSRFLSTFHMKNLLIAANLDTAPTMLWNSGANDYGWWDPGTNLAAQYSLAVGTGAIMGLDGGHEFLFVFCERGIWRAVWSGTDVQMEFVQVPTNAGVRVPNSLIRLGTQSQTLQEGVQAFWAWMGDDGFFMLDGERVIPAGEAIRRWVFDRIDGDKLDLVRACVMPTWHLAIWTFPEKGATYNTHSVAFDYETGEWFPADIGFTALGNYDLNAGDSAQWDSLVGTINRQTRVFDVMGGLPQPVAIVGQTDGKVYYLAHGVNRNGTAIDAYRRTPVFIPGQSEDGPMRASDLQRVSVVSTAAPGSKLAVAARASDNPYHLTRQDEDGLSHIVEDHQVTIASEEVEAGFNSASKAWQIEVRNSEASEQLGVVTIEAQTKIRNR